MAPRGWQRLFFHEGKVRSGWRILLFLILFLFLLAVLAPFASLAPGSGVSPLLTQSVLGLAAALGAGWILLAVVDRRPAGALGFAWTRDTLRELGLGFVIGTASIGVVAVAFTLFGWVEYRPEGGTTGAYLGSLGAALIFFLVAAAAEEAFFRGYPFQVLVQGIGPGPATLVASAAFAAAHWWNPNIGALALLNIFLAGILLSVAYLRTRSLWFATTVHLGWNWSMASLFDLPVSGLTGVNTPLYEPAVTGPAWVTGGIFGPEGGIGGSVAALIALAAVLWLPWVRESPGMRALRPLVNERESSRWLR